MSAQEYQLWKNKARCKNCGDVLESIHGHDFVTCTCFRQRQGRGIFIDGGRNMYTRSGGNPEDFERIKERVE